MSAVGNVLIGLENAGGIDISAINFQNVGPVLFGYNFDLAELIYL